MEVTGGFLLLAAWLNYLDRQGIVPLALLSCTLHELGHLLVLLLLGVRVRRLSITAVGAEMEIDRSLSYGGEVLAALAGPLVNLALALTFCRFSWGWVFAGLNLALGCFNLLPVGRLDGGRALHCLLSMSIGPAAEEAEAVLDRVLIAFLLALGVLLIGWGGSFTLLLVALWLLAKEKEGKKGRNRSCQGLQKRVKWFLHSK